VELGRVRRQEDQLEAVGAGGDELFGGSRGVRGVAVDDQEDLPARTGPTDGRCRLVR
jgi:hypothetical protein